MRPQKPQKKSGFRWGIIVLVLALVGGALVVWNWMPRGVRDVAERLATGGRQIIIDERFGLAARAYRLHSLTLPCDADLEVSLEVQGDGVNVYMLDDANFKVFKRNVETLFGQKPYTHYPEFQMLKAQKATTRGRLKRGTYYLIIQNPTFGILTRSSFDVHLTVVGNP